MLRVTVKVLAEVPESVRVPVPFLVRASAPPVF